MTSFITTSVPRSRTARAVAGAAAVTLVLAGCSSAASVTGGEGTTSGASSASSSTAANATAATAGTVWDASAVHTIDVEIDPDVLADLLATYEASGDKDWASATVTIDGETFENVGIKLKGNSSLKGVTADDDPTALPWRIRLDKYVDGQNLDGYTDFAVRPNGSESSLNEAVALDMLADAGLATQKAIATAFSLNGSEASLRLTIQNPDDAWVADNFPDAGTDSVLYKVESGADWSYEGDDADYSASFDIDAGPTDYAPLAELLELLDTGTDEEIAQQLPELVDLESFATYLAVEDLVGNFDTIAGPGNNAYLFWDSAAQQFTVVAWDHDRAFGVQLGGEGGGEGQGGPGWGSGERPTDMPAMPEGMELPDGAELPEGAVPPEGMELPDGAELPSGEVPTDGTAPADGTAPPEGGFPGGGFSGAGPGAGAGGPGNGGGMGGSALSDAVTNNAEWSALVTERKTELQASLYDSGTLAASVEAWAAVVSSSGLVPEETVRTEADAILAYSDGTATSSTGMPGSRRSGGENDDAESPAPSGA